MCDLDELGASKSFKKYYNTVLKLIRIFMTYLFISTHIVFITDRRTHTMIMQNVIIALMTTFYSRNKFDFNEKSYVIGDWIFYFI
jgi:hypothetical protein